MVGSTQLIFFFWISVTSGKLVIFNSDLFSNSFNENDSRDFKNNIQTFERNVKQVKTGFLQIPLNTFHILRERTFL